MRRATGRDPATWVAVTLALLVIGVGLSLLVRHPGTTPSGPASSPPTSPTTGGSGGRSLHPASGTLAPTAPGSAQGSALGSALGAYSVSGTTILDPQRNPYVPYGITEFGLSGDFSDWQAQIPEEQARMAAIAGFWHGNTVRMQIAPTWVTGNTAGFLPAVEGLVSLAERDGLNVIISAQYQYTTKQPMPTAETAAFWRIMDRQYGHDPRVWFDLFNEPQLGPNTYATTYSQIWQFWRNGGTITKDGRTVRYVGMQQLVDGIRSVDTTNLLLVEGIQGAKSLNDVADFRLDGAGILYAIHSYLEPGFDTPADWQADWGRVASQLPVIDDEFGEQEGTVSSCRTNAPTLVPQLLSFLAAHHIGLIAHALVPGSLIEGYALTDPTSFFPSTPYQCGKANKGVDNQGAGQDILQYFATRAAGS